MEHIDEDQSARSAASVHDLEEGTSNIVYAESDTQPLREKRRRRRRVSESYRQRIASKKRLSMAFGISVLSTVITYLVLAVTGIAHGLMFHILSVLFVLVLAGAFLHSSIRLVMLQKRRRVRLARTQHRDWHGTNSEITESNGSHTHADDTVDPFTDPVSEKPVQITMGAEEVITTTPRGKNKRVIRQPPPIYGNFRESKRMNPEMVFWHKREPSPTTPTYAEALNDVETRVGYQPPEYISPRKERQIFQGEHASNVHPLERERLIGLMGHTMSSSR